MNAPLDRIIMYAYGLREYQLMGGPSWLRSDRFDIVAKYPEGWSRNASHVSLMVRDLLADRFKLKAHTETRANPTYSDLSCNQSAGRWKFL